MIFIQNKFGYYSDNEDDSVRSLHCLNNRVRFYPRFATVNRPSI